MTKRSSRDTFATSAPIQSCFHQPRCALAVSWIKRKPPWAGAQTLMQMRGGGFDRMTAVPINFSKWIIKMRIKKKKKRLCKKNKRQTNASKSLSVLLRAVHLRGSHLPLCLSQTHTSRMDRRLIRSPSPSPSFPLLLKHYTRAHRCHTQHQQN